MDTRSLASTERLAKGFSELYGGVYALSEVRQMFHDIPHEKTVRRIRKHVPTWEVLMGGEKWDMTKLRVPFLALTASPRRIGKDWLGREILEPVQIAEARSKRLQPLRGVTGSRAVEIKGATWFVFPCHEEKVLAEMRQFLVGLGY